MYYEYLWSCVRHVEAKCPTATGNISKQQATCSVQVACCFDMLLVWTGLNGNHDYGPDQPMSAFLSAGESLTPSPVTATMAPWRWQPSTMMSFCWGDVRAKTISACSLSTRSICAGVMSRRSDPWTTYARVSLTDSARPPTWQGEPEHTIPSYCPAPSNVAVESDLRKKTCRKNGTCSNREILFRKKKNCESFRDTRTQDSFRKSLSTAILLKENFLVCVILHVPYGSATPAAAAGLRG